MWNFHYSAGYQTFTENGSLSNRTTPELSINPIASSTKQPLTNVSWSQFRQLTTPISEFSYVGKPLSKLELRGGYIFYRYSGPVNFTQAFNGIAPNATGVLTPYMVTQGARATVTEPNHIIDEALTYRFYHLFAAGLDYPYSRFTSDVLGNFNSLFNGTTSTTTAPDVGC